MISTVSNHFSSKAATLLLTLENRLDRILQGWLLVAGLACALRIMSSRPAAVAPDLGAVAPYLLLIVAPFLSTLLALRWFADGDRQAQPGTRLAIAGRWRTVARAEARRHPLFGTGGIMVSLMVGMMINVPMRGLEYLAIMPPVPSSAPHWLLALRTAMTLDVVLFTSLYMVAFVAALRRVPLFPRLLAAIWLCDLAMQVGIAQWIPMHSMPASVADALQTLLAGNAKKVLISIGLWLPYLLLSTRVNVTYRSRVPA